MNTDIGEPRKAAGAQLASALDEIGAPTRERLRDRE